MEKNQKKITILIPVYNEEKVLDQLLARVVKVINQLNHYQFQLLFVDDGSSDNTMAIIKDAHSTYDFIDYVELSRNFGKETAMLAGFDYADGDAVVIMDADLQHPPEMIEEMTYWWEEGYEDVYTVRKQRNEESAIRRYFSKLYYKLLTTLSNEPVYPSAGDFRLLDRKVVEALRRMRETERNTKGLYAWVGFRKKELTYEEGLRAAGETKWSFRNLISLAVNGITSYSTVPLRIWSIIGLVISGLSFLFLIVEMFKVLFFQDAVSGYPTLIAFVVFLGGIQLISLGVIGEYLAKVFTETKDRPAYFVRDASLDEEKKKKDAKNNDKVDEDES